MGAKNNTATTTSSPNPAAQQAYLSLMGQAATVGATPYQAYTGELVPGVNAQQTTGINAINSNANYAQPFIGQAAGLATQAATPLTAAQIQQYQSPYTQSVVNATQAQFNNANQQQLQGVKGNAIAQGALGGNREAVAEAETTNQQQLAQAPVIAGLENQGYQTGLNTALAEQQAQAQGAYSLGNLGVSGQNAALTGANAQVGAGNLQYGVASAQDQAAYQQFLNQQAFPYQQLQWEAGIQSGLGSNLGGTSTTTSPGPSTLGQIAGLGTTIAGGLGATGAYGSTGWLSSLLPLAAAKDGGRIQGVAHYDVGGGVSTPQFGGGYGVGTIPYGGGHSWVPSIGITHGRGAPQPPGIQNPQGGDLGQMQKDIGALASSFPKSNSISTSGVGAGFPQVGSPDASQFDANGYAIYGGPHAMGGRIGLADGGTTDYTPDSRTNLGLAAGLNYATALSPEMIQQYTADMAHKYGPQWQQMRAPAMTAYARGYAEGGSPEGDIDATDINLNGGTGGLGLGATYEPTNPAITADSKYTPNGDALPSEITQGTSHPTGVAPPSHAMAFTDDNTAPSSYDHSATPTPAYENPSPWGAVMAAGLGMLASRSPFAGVAIGEGGLTGLKQYGAEVNQAQQNRRIDLESQRLDQAAKQAQDRLNLETEAQQHGTQYQRFEESKPFPAGQTIGPLGLPITTYMRIDPDTGKMVPAQPPGAGPQGSADGTAPVSPILDPDSRKVIADQYIAGDHTALSGLGFGNIGAVNRGAVWSEISSKLKASGATGTDLAAAKANFMAESAGARTAAVRGANIDMSIQEAQQTFPLALDASAAVPRSQFVPWNKAVQMVQAGTSSPELARYVTANQAVITAYAQAMSRANVTTDHSRQRAEELLSTATSPEAYQAVLDQMGKEMHAAQLAPDAVRKDIESRITGRAAAPAAGAAPTVTAPSGASSPVHVQSPADAAKLPSGTKIILPDGRLGTVP